MTTDIHHGIIHIPAGGRRPVPEGCLGSVLLTGAETAGVLTLAAGVFPPGSGCPPLHMHAQAETFMLFAGDVAFTTVVADSPHTFTLQPGGVVYVPPRTPHQFMIVGTEAHGIMAVTPGGFERYLAEMGTATRPDGSRDVERQREIAARYGVAYVRLPGR
jgi:mannose-6-phosphate isomerase-like protein (cupin superfamily)